MNKGERIFAAAFGLFLLGIGVFVLIEPPFDWRTIGGLFLVVVGGNALYASYVGKRSWLAKIGPLP